MAHLTRADFSFGIRGLLSATNSRETEECEAGGLSEDGLGRQALKIDLLPFRSIVALNVHAKIWCAQRLTKSHLILAIVRWCGQAVKWPLFNFNPCALGNSHDKI